MDRTAFPDYARARTYHLETTMPHRWTAKALPIAILIGPTLAVIAAELYRHCWRQAYEVMYLNQRGEPITVDLYLPRGSRPLCKEDPLELTRTVEDRIIRALVAHGGVAEPDIASVHSVLRIGIHGMQMTYAADR